MKRYSKYKEASLPWLNLIPDHWDVVRNKNVFVESDDRVGAEKDQYTLLSLTLNGIIPRDVTSGKGKFPQDYDQYKIVKKCDIAFCLFDIDETPRTVGLSSYEGMLTGAYDIFHVSNANPNYLLYYYLSLDNQKALRPLYTGLRKTIPVRVFMGTKLPLPPREEQEQIVRYLDWQTSRIDKIIAAKQKQIALLEEQKKAAVNDAVTHGLNVNIPMKYSGVEWLGEIPAHWDVVKLRQILRPVSVKNHPNLPLLSVVREKGVILRDLEDKESNHNFVPDDLSNYKVVRKKQFVMNKMKAWQGSYGISPYDGIVSPAYYVFDVDFKNLEYFHYAIRSKVYVNFFAQASDGIRVGQWDLSMAKLKEIPFIVPPDEEQREIVAQIPELLKEYDALIKKLNDYIDRLNEYKSKLISDVVTGQADVRGISF